MQECDPVANWQIETKVLAQTDWCSFLIAVSLMSSVGHAIAAESVRPNIVFLLTDDQRADCLSCTGNNILRTPHLDDLAARGVSFKNAFVTTSICATSRASIMTGQYAARHGIIDFGTSLSQEQLQQSYFGLLHQAGYRVGFVGKWGVGKPPADGPLDYNHGYPGQGTYYNYNSAETTPEHLTARLARQALQFLGDEPDNRPFCLSVSFKAPHADESPQAPREYNANPKWEFLYLNQSIPAPRLAEPAFYHSLPGFLQKTENRVRWQRRFSSDELYQQSVRGYYGLITGVDHVVGEIIDRLEELSVAENTIIIFTSDNGYYLGERGWSDKWYAHEASIRVPLIVYDPPLTADQRGRTVTEMALNIDFAPTMLECAGVDAPAAMQGRSLLPLVRGEAPPDWRTEFFYEHLFRHPRIPRSEGVRTRRWKYICYLDSQPYFEELYDLERDPYEATNLAYDTEHAAELVQMRDKWRVWRQRVHVHDSQDWRGEKLNH